MLVILRISRSVKIISKRRFVHLKKDQLSVNGVDDTSKTSVHIDEVPNFKVKENVLETEVEDMANHLAASDASSISPDSEDVFVNSHGDKTDRIAGQFDPDTFIMDNFIAKNSIDIHGMDNGGFGHKLENNIRLEEDAESIRIIIEYKKPRHNREDTNLITKFKHSIFSSWGLSKTKSVNDGNTSIKTEVFDDSGENAGCYEMAAEASAQQKQAPDLDDKLSKLILAEQKLAELKNRMNSTKQRIAEIEGLEEVTYQNNK